MTGVQRRGDHPSKLLADDLLRRVHNGELRVDQAVDALSPRAHR